MLRLYMRERKTERQLSYYVHAARKRRAEGCLNLDLVKTMCSVCAVRVLLKVECAALQESRPQGFVLFICDINAIVLPRACRNLGLCSESLCKSQWNIYSLSCVQKCT